MRDMSRSSCLSFVLSNNIALDDYRGIDPIVAISDLSELSNDVLIFIKSQVARIEKQFLANKEYQRKNKEVDESRASIVNKVFFS